ncbi:MAG: hypothetical protein JNL70_18670 [Saprospiraceae bacterium]|nr:hypothetical protein [Saprospiraceae bacterium]
MKIIGIIILLFSSVLSYAQIKDYSQRAFDSDTCCWRLLSASKNYRAAAELIVQYMKECSGTKNTHALNWHAGQMFALSNDGIQARKYFKKTYSFVYKIGSDDDGKMWYYYAKGTVAFVERRRKRLQKILRHWEAHYPCTKNYFALKKLYDNWDLTYAEASQ